MTLTPADLAGLETAYPSPSQSSRLAYVADRRAAEGAMVAGLVRAGVTRVRARALAVDALRLVASGRLERSAELRASISAASRLKAEAAADGAGQRMATVPLPVRAACVMAAKAAGSDVRLSAGAKSLLAEVKGAVGT